MKENPSVKQGYVKITKKLDEDPHDTIQYLLRGKKTIKLPVSFSFRIIWY